jgi:hypothetical protein
VLSIEEERTAVGEPYHPQERQGPLLDAERSHIAMSLFDLHRRFIWPIASNCSLAGSGEKYGRQEKV